VGNHEVDDEDQGPDQPEDEDRLDHAADEVGGHTACDSPGFGYRHRERVSGRLPARAGALRHPAACSPTTRVFQAAVPVRWHPSLTESVGECTDGGGVLATPREAPPLGRSWPVIMPKHACVTSATNTPHSFRQVQLRETSPSSSAPEDRLRGLRRQARAARKTSLNLAQVIAKSPETPKTEELVAERSRSGR